MHARTEEPFARQHGVSSIRKKCSRTNLIYEKLENYSRRTFNREWTRHVCVSKRNGPHCWRSSRRDWFAPDWGVRPRQQRYLRTGGCEMKIAIASIVFALIGSGCSSTPSLIRALSKDQAIVTVRVGTPWGVQSFTRVGSTSNSVNVAPDGAITINATQPPPVR